MLEYPEGGLEACFESECCYCWAAGAFMLGVWCTTREEANREHDEGFRVTNCC